MDITELPYNALLGIEATPEGGLQLADHPRYTNHVGTVHAGALFSLAEAASGNFLLSQPAIDAGKVGALLRASSIKYRRPATGRLTSKAGCADDALEAMRSALANRGRARIVIEVDLLDASGEVVAGGTFEWFVSKPNLPA